jgi:hypothetical protein
VDRSQTIQGGNTAIADQGSAAVGNDGCADAASEDAVDSTISIICGMSPEFVVQLVAGVSSPNPELKAQALELLRAQVSEDSRFRVEAIASFFKILGREEVPPEELQDTFAQIARENLALCERLETFEGDDPAVGALR